ncbi:MAG: Ig-like domain-containing protein, partial [Cytophagaceae bacterium]|nr:Ig-like domain-containing protein [Cytophagaceae bacterium]
NGTTTISGATAATYTATASGTYSVLVRNASNCSATSTATSVTVQPTPSTVTLTPSGTQTVLPNQTITLTANTSTSGVTYRWYQGTTVIGSNSPNLVVTQPAAYRVEASIGSCVSSSNVVNIIGATAPSVRLISPLNNATSVAPASIVLQAEASDVDGTVSKVEFYQNNIKIGERTSGVFELTISNLAQGNYTFYAIATDNSGLQTTSLTINYSVTANLSPTINTLSVVYQQPTPGSTTTGDISISVTAIDPEGGALIVEIYDGLTLVTTLTNPPFTHMIQNPSVGTHDITVKVRDSQGNEVSQNRSVLVLPVSTSTLKANTLDVTYYPNPYQEAINIEVEGSIDYLIQDLSGKTIEKGTIIQSGQIGDNLPAAIYIVILQQQDKRSVLKIEKQ